MSFLSVFSPYDGFTLAGSVYTGTAPMATYDLARFEYARPDWRVKYNVTSVTVTATGTSRKADVVAVPMHNATAITIANNNGLGAQALTIPAIPSDGIPLTAVLDLRPLASASTRTATVWTFVFTGPSNITLGALLWLGTVSELEFTVGLVVKEKRFNGGDANFFGIKNRVRARTRERFVELVDPADFTQRAALVSWARAGEGSGLPSLLWTKTNVNDALIGTLRDEYGGPETTNDYAPFSVTFTELNKGLPLV